VAFHSFFKIAFFDAFFEIQPGWSTGVMAEGLKPSLSILQYSRTPLLQDRVYFRIETFETFG